MKSRNLWTWPLIIFVCLLLMIWLIWTLSGGCASTLKEEISTTSTSTTTTTPFSSSTTIIASGSLDTSFGSSGEVTYDDFVAKGMAIDPSGRILVVGYPDSDPSSMNILRYDTNGNLDNSFNGDGIVVDSRGNGNAIVLDASGKILVAGTSSMNIGLWRYESNGSPDNTFGNAGLVTSEGAGGAGGVLANAIAVSSGKIIVAGECFYPFQAVVWRFNTNGTLDTGFGGGKGYVVQDGALGPNGEDHTSSVTVASSGKILVTGSSRADYNVDPDAENHIVIWKLNSNGAVDKVAVYSDSDASNGNNIFVNSAGMVTVTGNNYITVGPLSHVHRLAIWRYTSNLEFDRLINILGSKCKDYTSGGAVDASGRILITGKEAGFSLTGTLLSQSMAIWRYNSDGTVDNSFSGGKTTYLLNGLDETSGGRFIATDPWGRIIVAGSNRTATSARALTIWRYR